MTAASAPPAQVQLGDPQHGVARYARQVADAVDRATGVTVQLSLAECLADPPARVHVHFTDRMWGSSPEDAADTFTRLAGVTSVSVTLHDLPQASDGARNLARRIDCYARVVAASTGVACNSEHEAQLLAEYVSETVTVEVIPLPVDIHDGHNSSDTHGPAGQLDGAVALVGFVYPGKGHSDALDAVAVITGQRPAVVALGRASPGHEGDLVDLHNYAESRGVLFSATGFLDDAELVERCRRAGVPLAAHQHVSASGSLATWISAGRRPLVPNTRYSREMSTLRPGTVTLYDTSTLAESIATALADPASTWLDANASTGPNTPEVAERYLRWWGTLAW
ncbi:MAG: permease [Glaciihabitans sp.]|nr:permease [Glaciihabitans sp.]